MTSYEDLALRLDRAGDEIPPAETEMMSELVRLDFMLQNLQGLGPLHREVRDAALALLEDARSRTPTAADLISTLEVIVETLAGGN